VVADLNLSRIDRIPPGKHQSADFPVSTDRWRDMRDTIGARTVPVVIGIRVVDLEAHPGSRVGVNVATATTQATTGAMEEDIGCIGARPTKS